MSFAELDKHHAIAWDFDQTLIDHPKSREMHAYILAHPEKYHVILTFRTHGLLQDIWYDLARKYPDTAPPPEAFQDVLSIPPQAWMDFMREDRKRPRDENHPAIVYYVRWKGAVCADQGLTVLVDDKIEHVLDGCREHGVVLINPDDL